MSKLALGACAVLALVLSWAISRREQIKAARRERARLDGFHHSGVSQ